MMTHIKLMSATPAENRAELNGTEQRVSVASQALPVLLSPMWAGEMEKTIPAVRRLLPGPTSLCSSCNWL